MRKIALHEQHRIKEHNLLGALKKPKISTNVFLKQ